MRRLASVTCAIAMVVSASAAQAATISFNNVIGTWSLGDPAANVTYRNNSTQVASADWGGAFPTGSGYDFAGAAPPQIDVAVPPSPSATFDLGTFTHRNNPIPAGSSITGIRLTVTTDVFVDAVAQGSKNFVFDFTHFETPNGNDPCADGGALGVGINDNGCADRVTFNYNALSDSFQVGSTIYTVNLAGFLVGNTQVTDFWTREQANNSAVLRGQIVERSTIPEPASLFLLGAGLLGLARVRRQ